MQLKPTPIPKWTRDNNTSQKFSSLPFRQDDISCPAGTIIVKRATVEDLIQDQVLRSLKQVSSKDNKIDITGHHVRINLFFVTHS